MLQITSRCPSVKKTFQFDFVTLKGQIHSVKFEVVQLNYFEQLQNSPGWPTFQVITVTLYLKFTPETDVNNLQMGLGDSGLTFQFDFAVEKVKVDVMGSVLKGY